jgi:hypothetical protein
MKLVAQGNSVILSWVHTNLKDELVYYVLHRPHARVDRSPKKHMHKITSSQLAVGCFCTHTSMHFTYTYMYKSAPVRV